MEYQPLRPTKAPKVLPSAVTPESLYWRKFRSPIFVKEYAPVTSIQFVPEIASSSSGAVPASARQKFAVTAATRVQIYSMRTDRVVKTISRFADVARSGNIRQDGKLVVAGDDSGLVQVFDINSRAILRTMRGHELPVHVTRFSTNQTQIMSASDDRTVRLWDMPEQKALRNFRGHSDYVRAGVVSVDNPSLLLSGSYDGTVRLWDARMGEKEGEALTMRHGAPVEDVLVFPTGGGGVALSAGGPVLRVWDLMMGGRCVRAISNHQKTITSLALSTSSGADATAEGGAGGMRLLSAGLDHLVKVYDPARDYRVTHTMRYPAPVLSLAVSPDESHVAAGMADGTLCIRKRDLRQAEIERREQDRAALAAGSYEHFMEAGTTLRGQTAKGRQQGVAAADELRVEAARRRKLKDYDRLLKSFRYRDALDAALRKDVPAAVTFALLQELIHRSPTSATGVGADGLRRALAGRDDIALEPILRFLLRHASNPQYADLLCDTMNVVVDTYSSVLGQSPLVDDLFGRIWAKVTEEVRLQRELAQVRGALEMVLARSALGAA